MRKRLKLITTLVTKKVDDSTLLDWRTREFVFETVELTNLRFGIVARHMDPLRSPTNINTKEDTGVEETWDGDDKFFRFLSTQ